MRYILEENAIAQLAALRKTYETQKNINLEQKPSLIGRPIFLGGVDVEKRKAQISFLERIIHILKPNLLTKEEIDTPEKLEASITASRVVLAACLYVKSQISGSGSVLSVQINNALGITENNYLDDEDKEICFLAANRVINSNSVLVNLEEANASLRKSDFLPFSEIEWKEFADYLGAKCTKKDAHQGTRYPIASITKPLFGAAFSSTGAAIGMLGGDLLANTGESLPPALRLTAWIGKTILVFAPAKKTGVAIIAPIVAAKVTNAVFKISLAQILGFSMGILGNGVGMFIGYPLDLSCKLIWKACLLIGHYYFPDPSQPKTTGFRVGDGNLVINGLTIKIMAEDKIPQDCDVRHVEVQENGDVTIDGESIPAPDLENVVPEKLIEDIQFSLQQSNTANLDNTPELVTHEDETLPNYMPKGCE